MGYNQRKKEKKCKEQWRSIQIKEHGAVIKPGKGSRRGNNKPKILTRRMKKLVVEIEQEERELLELQEKMLDKASTSESKKTKKTEKSKSEQKSKQQTELIAGGSEDSDMEM